MYMNSDNAKTSDLRRLVILCSKQKKFLKTYMAI